MSNMPTTGCPRLTAAWLCPRQECVAQRCLGTGSKDSWMPLHSWALPRPGLFILGRCWPSVYSHPNSQPWLPSSDLSWLLAPMCWQHRETSWGLHDTEGTPSPGTSCCRCINTLTFEPPDRINSSIASPLSSLFWTLHFAWSTSLLGLSSSFCYWVS